MTIVTHGYVPTDDVANQPAQTWLPHMAAAVADRLGSGTAIYSLKIGVSGTSARVTSFTRLLGPPPMSPESFNGETVIMLDWAEASGLFNSYYHTEGIAGLVVPYLATAVPEAGITSPLAESPIHLIGHSRGGSLVADLARQLGQRGVWVDHLTTLDPHPVQGNVAPFMYDYADASVHLYANTVFADNYWQADPNSTTPDGQPVTGAHNLKLSTSVLSTGGYNAGLLDGGAHADVHLWYQGTIDTSGNARDDAHPVPPAWYAGDMGPRDQTGYAFAREGNIIRPDDGLSAAFGGTASRYAVTGATGPQWPNVGGLRITSAGDAFQSGQTLGTQFYFQDNDSAATVTFYLDQDKNPYGSGYKVGTYSPGATGAGVFRPSGDFNLSTAGVPAGEYWVMAAISDGTHRRFVYTETTVTLTSPPPPPPPPPRLAANLSPEIYYVPSTMNPTDRNISPGLFINNTGSLRARGSVTVRYYASADATADAGDVYLGGRTFKVNIAPGGYKNFNVKFNGPWNVPTGSYRIVAAIEPAPSIGDSSADDNLTMSDDTTAIQAPRVDVAASLFSAPSTLRNGKRGTAVVRVTNNGNVTASGYYSFDVAMSADGTGNGGTVVGRFGRSLKLKPFSTVYLKVPVRVFAATSGYLSGVMNYTGSPSDERADNNGFFSASPVTVV